MEHVLNVIHCGIDESEVIRVALKDCEIVKKKQTNADRIRNMTDEELAEFMLFFAPTKFVRGMYTGISGKYTETAEETIQNNLGWLKSPAESEG